VAFGVISFVALCALSVPAASFYNDPRITMMIIVLGLSLLVGSLENTGVILYRREMNFAKEFQLRATAKIVASVVAVVAAFMLKSYWALLIGTFCGRAVSTLISFLLHSHRPRITMSARHELLGFSIWLWLGNLLTFLRVRLVELMLGRIVGPRSLGLFSVASELSQLASTEIAAPINRALFSSYADAGGESRAVGRAYVEAAPVIWALTLPIVIVMFVGAPQIVLLVLGDQWTEAVPILRWLAVAAILNLLSSGAIQAYWAIDQARLEVVVEVVAVTCLVILVLVMTGRMGVEGAAIAMVLCNGLLVPLNMLLLRHFAGVSIRETIARSWRILVACSAMFAATRFAFGDWVAQRSLEALWMLAALTVSAAVIYLVVLLFLWSVVGRPAGVEQMLLGKAKGWLAGRSAADATVVPSSGPVDSSTRAAQAVVSVIVPAYNSARYIRQAIESVLAQTYPALDIIVVDDGSTDATREIVSEFEPRVRVLRQANAGAAAARNLALKCATGDYVAFLDADDFWHPRKIEWQVRHLETCQQCIAVYCNKVEYRSAAEKLDWDLASDLPAPTVLSDETGNGGWVYCDLIRDSIVHTSTIMVRREAIETVGMFETTLRKGQDLDYWLRLSRLGRIHKLRAVISAYRIHPESISYRILSDNFHAQVLEMAVGRYGLVSGDDSLTENEYSRILWASWIEFAYQHYRIGSERIARESLARALRLRPLYLKSLWLAARMRMQPKSNTSDRSA
jgi:glycosyltransferase involved in cell wall biosynthesis/O-antigen/teichoic acid export membrane protein